MKERFAKSLNDHLRIIVLIEAAVALAVIIFSVIYVTWFK